jgi:hypothetical protein
MPPEKADSQSIGAIMDILSIIGQVLFSAPAETTKELVEAAVRAKASLSSADLHYADLSFANLSFASLRYADLSYANLSYASLNYATLNSAKNIPAIIAAQLSIVPETGSFEGWKKCRDGVIVLLRIPANAKRSNGTERKCRCSEAEVVAVFGGAVGISIHDDTFIYEVGKTVRPSGFNEDRWATCGEGIHFFITRKEAEEYE